MNMPSIKLIVNISVPPGAEHDPEVQESIRQIAAERLGKDYIGGAADVAVLPVPGVDAKYGEVFLSNKSVNPGEPVFVLRAQDAYSVEMLQVYLSACRNARLSDEHIAAVVNSGQAFNRWRHEHRALVKFPDTI
jgi:homoaconitase/3-isopropylmalate dehydratase large subunit